MRNAFSKIDDGSWRNRLTVRFSIVIGFAFLFGTRNTWAHAVMIAGLAVTIGVVLLSIVALEHPYSGIQRVTPEAFEQSLRILGG